MIFPAACYSVPQEGPVKRPLADAPAATCAAYQSELKRLRDSSLISTLMAPFVPGPALFLMGFLVPEPGLLKAVGLTTALIASSFLLALPALRRKRQMLEREIDSLNALMK